MGALILSVKELEIDRAEADKLAEAIKAVAVYYPHSFDPKIMAWANLGIVAAGVYGTRALAWRNRISREKAQKPIAVMPAAGRVTSPQPAAAPPRAPLVNGKDSDPPRSFSPSEIFGPQGAGEEPDAPTF